MGSIVVAGGYGAFGERAIARLARDPDLDIIVAGRDRAKAEAAVAGRWSTARARLSAARIDASTVTPAELSALQARVVVNASGPFQDLDYTLARAAIAAGAHYVDLADARAFVRGISALDDEARRAGVLVLSGASSVPGLSSAVVAHFSAEFDPLTHLAIGISPGNSFDPGVATAASILSGIGRPFMALQDGQQRTRHGWQGLTRETIGGLGRRWMSPVEVPDLDLMPAHFPELRTVDFRAGLEVGLFHLGLAALAWPARAGVVCHPEWLARPLMAAKRVLAFLGSDRGGMFVTMKGLRPDGQPHQRRWDLVAGSGHGPYVPALAAAVLARKLARGEEARTGAMACFGHVTLDEFKREADDLDIVMSVR